MNNHTKRLAWASVCFAQNIASIVLNIKFDISIHNLELLRGTLVEAKERKQLNSTQLAKENQRKVKKARP